MILLLLSRIDRFLTVTLGNLKQVFPGAGSDLDREPARRLVTPKLK
jgi:hypothetical protein